VADTESGLLGREKDRARSLLADGFANDWIDQDELDERLEAVERARELDELHIITADLKRLAAEPPGPGDVTQALVPISRPPPPEKIGVLLGMVERHGSWSVEARTQVRVLLGSALLDLRTAELPEGPIEIDVKVTLGSLDVYVPPGWHIDNRCGAVLAAVEQDESHAPTTLESRILRLTGRVVLGNLAVHERLPGETGGEARRRRKRERKALTEGHATQDER
jgi:hypothetical protein